MRTSELVVAFVALSLVGANANAQSGNVGQPPVTSESARERSGGPVVKGRALYEEHAGTSVEASQFEIFVHNTR